MELQELIQAIGSSVQQAQKMIEHNAAHHFFNQYFSSEPIEDSNAEQAWHPKTENVCVTRPDGKKVNMTVPIMTLVNHNTMALDQIRIKVNVKISVDQSTGNLNADVEGVDNQEGGVKNEIELTFNRNIPSEGISRVNQEAINII